MRYLNHTSSFRNIQYRESTALSKYIWTLKEKNEDYDIKWSVAAKAPSYSPTIKSCYLCLTEKTLILTSQHEHLLNKRNELMGTCRHRRKFLLSGITEITIVVTVLKLQFLQCLFLKNLLNFSMLIRELIYRNQQKFIHSDNY